ncbi:uri1, prefoldin-like chaperone, partial [Dimargaris verticillata]
MDFDAQANLDRLVGAIQGDLETQQAAAAQYIQYLSEYRAVDQALATLPLETSYDAFIPFGSLAFMPGRLIHTNEVLVLLGDNWFVERSASQARAMAQRRIQYVEDNLEKVQAHIQALTQRLHLTTELNQMHTGRFNEDGDPIVDIVERVDDHTASGSERQTPLPRSTSTPAELSVRPIVVDKPPEQFDDADRALLATLDKFEKMELDQDELINDSSAKPAASSSSQYTPLTDLDRETPSIITDVRPKTPTTPGTRPLKSSLKSPLTPPPSTRKSVYFDDSRNQIYEDTRTFPDPIQERINASQLSLNPKSRARIVMLPPSEASSPPTATADKDQTTDL